LKKYKNIQCWYDVIVEKLILTLRKKFQIYVILLKYFCLDLREYVMNFWFITALQNSLSWTKCTVHYTKNIPTTVL